MMSTGLPSHFMEATEPSPTSVVELLMEPSAYIISAIVLFFIGFFGFFLNLIVIVLMCKDKQLWTPLNAILFNLVCSDFSVSILGNPFTFASAIAKRWLFGSAMCVIYGFFMSLLGITSITTLTVLSFERYLMVSRPLSAPRYLTRKRAIFTILAIWLYSFTLTTPPLIGWGEYINESGNISCSVNWETRSYGNTTYILFLFMFGLIVPVSVIIFSYLNIIRTMRQQTNMNAGRVSKAENRVTWMIAIMIIAFLVAWTPYAVLALLIQFGSDLNHTAGNNNRGVISPVISLIPALVAKSSICYNPLIYVGLNTQFRSAWRNIFGLSSTDDESHYIQNDQTKTASKTIMHSVQDSTDEKRKFASLLVTVDRKNGYSTNGYNNVKMTKTIQLMQFFPHTEKSNLLKTTSLKDTKRKLSTVIQENDIVETILISNTSESLSKKFSTSCECL